MRRTVRVGQRLPNVDLAYLDSTILCRVRPDELFAGIRVVLIGLPGAFTPVCHGRHLPDYVAAAPQLRAAGYDMIAWISPNDPWTQDAWASQIDPENRLRRFSDGNLAFARQAGLASKADELFMGERCQRFVVILRDAVIERLFVEPSFTTFSCTQSASVLELA